jgi:outer membrane protein assembly factor BamB
MHAVGENFYRSSPTVANGVVYVGALVAESEADRLYGLSATSERELWSFFLDCCAGAGFGSPSIAHGHLYVNTANWKVFSFGLEGAS